MYTLYNGSSSAPAANGLFTAKAVARDDESHLAATLRITHGDADAPVAPKKRIAAPAAPASASVHALARRLVAEIVRVVEARLPGRVSGLKVVVQEDQFVLRGVSSSYYVKQVAGHLAMTTIDARLLGRLVNEIEVRSVR